MIKITKRKTCGIDKKLGLRLKELRTLRGVALSDMAKVCGVSIQQFTKYENGQSRITAARLYQISDLLEVKIDEFFKGLGGE